jgi:hypothetical protein
MHKPGLLSWMVLAFAGLLLPALILLTLPV